jgi:hypothetical protein
MLSIEEEFNIYWVLFSKELNRMGIIIYRGGLVKGFSRKKSPEFKSK